MSRASIERRLTALSTELLSFREQLRVVDEQILHFADSADEASLRAIVSETPQAVREHRHAARTVTNFQKHRKVVSDRVSLLEGKQDELLDQLLEEGA